MPRTIAIPSTILVAKGMKRVKTELGVTKTKGPPKEPNLEFSMWEYD